VELMRDPEKLRSMSSAARNYALDQSWDAVFDNVYQHYHQMLAARIAVTENPPTVSPDFSTASAAPSASAIPY
jgi:hypothetical protein